MDDSAASFRSSASGGSRRQMFCRDRSVMKRKLMKNLWTLIALGGLAAMLYFGYKLIRQEMIYTENEKHIEEIYLQMETVEVETSEAAVDEEEAEKQRKLAQYQGLSEQNTDMVGWISIEGTVVNYPVMHTPEDSEFYLHRGFDKKYSAYGMIFMDGDCRLDGTSPNLLIYGHHMNNGAMFAEIENYDSKEYWQQHPVIEFNTLDEVQEYEVIAAFKQPAANLDEDFKNMLLAETKEEYEKLMNYLKGYRFYDTGMEAEYPDELITLTTCEYTQKDGRFFVVARKLQ